MFRMILVLSVLQFVFSCAKNSGNENEPASPDAKPIATVFPPDNPGGESTVVASEAPNAEETVAKNPSAQAKKFMVLSDVNVRKGADNKSAVVKKLKKNAIVTCNRQEPKGWCQLDDGFVAMKFLKAQ